MAAGSGTTLQRSKPLGARYLATWGLGGWQGAAGSSPASEAKMAAFDLLDLTRADRSCDPTLLDALGRRWVRVDPGYLPRFGALDELVHSDALVNTTVNPDGGAAAARGSGRPGLKAVA